MKLGMPMRGELIIAAARVDWPKREAESAWRRITSLYKPDLVAVVVFAGTGFLAWLCQMLLFPLSDDVVAFLAQVY